MYDSFPTRVINQLFALGLLIHLSHNYGMLLTNVYT